MLHGIDKRDIMTSLCIIILFCVLITPIVEVNDFKFQETDIENRMISSKIVQRERMDSYWSG